jgi:hypothetical protein
MTTAATPLNLVWGALPRNAGQHQANISTREELHAVLARIHADALARDLAQQVDVWAGSWKVGDPDLPDPLIQFLLGDPHRASLRWLSEQGAFRAVTPDLAPLPEPIRYDRGGTADDMEPEDTRLTPATVQHILDVYLQTGSRTQDITWIAL